MQHNENLTPEEYQEILKGKFVQTDEDKDGYSVRVFELNDEEYKVY